MYNFGRILSLKLFFFTIYILKIIRNSILDTAGINQAKKEYKLSCKASKLTDCVPKVIDFQEINLPKIKSNVIEILYEYCGVNLNKALVNATTLEILDVMMQAVDTMIILNENHIFHTDLKPENILIDSTGHLKLTDFGLSKSKVKEVSRKWIAKYYKNKKSMDNIKQKQESKPKEDQDSPKRTKRNKIIGTPHYVAPETISKNEYTNESDWWALGIIDFEMLVGEPPYQGNNPVEVYNSIMNDNKFTEMDIGYGDDQISPDAADFIDRLLNQLPEKRLGSKGIEEIKNHAFLQGMNWNALRQQEPPFIPKPMNIDDISYFDEKKAFSIESKIGRAHV